MALNLRMHPVAPDLDTPRFPDAALADLFYNISVDDDIDLSASLPDGVSLACTPDELIACYRLSWQLLDRGVELAAFRRLIAGIALRRDASADERVRYKAARARFKHMRFACANFDGRHRYPRALDRVTRRMGSFQDAFKNGQRVRTILLGLLLWASLHPVFYRAVRSRLAAFQPATLEGFDAYLKAEDRALRRNFRRPDAMINGSQFHDIRKIVSRRVAFNDTLRVVRPSVPHDSLSRYLATVNGLMGDLHDRLLEKKADGTQDYHRDAFAWPNEIARRLEAYIDACNRRET